MDDENVDHDDDGNFLEMGGVWNTDTTSVYKVEKNIFHLCWKPR